MSLAILSSSLSIGLNSIVSICISVGGRETTRELHSQVCNTHQPTATTNPAPAVTIPKAVDHKAPAKPRDILHPQFPPRAVRSSSPSYISRTTFNNAEMNYDLGMQEILRPQIQTFGEEMIVVRSKMDANNIMALLKVVLVFTELFK